MKLTWKKDNKSKKRPLAAISKYPNLPFDNQQGFEDSTKIDNENEDSRNFNPVVTSHEPSTSQSDRQLAESFQSQGDKLAEGGKYREALGKWEASLNLMPDNAVLHEQKAQVLLEIGDAWSALKAATRASELDPSWAEAWLTLGRAQLNFGEPDSAIESFDRALGIKMMATRENAYMLTVAIIGESREPDCKEAQDDRHTAGQLVKRRKQLHLSGMSANESRFLVGDEVNS